MKLLYYLIFFLLICPLMSGQEVTFQASIAAVNKEVEAKNYDLALSLLNPLIERFPENEEIKVYSGRIFSWKNDFKSAIEILKPLADKTNSNPDALLAIINCYYWSEQFETCIAYCNRYLNIKPNEFEISIIKINCLESQNRDQEALIVLKNLEVNSTNKQMITSINARLSRKSKKSITASYLNVSTSKPGQQPLHYAALEYLQKFDKSTIVGRINLGHANNDTQALFETNYYKTFTKKDYLYANAGISTGKTIFPIARFGLEYYFTPQKKIEYSFGLRYLNFEISAITILTAQVAYSLGVSTFGYRPYYDIKNKLASHSISYQNTNEQKEQIVKIELQYGNVPYLYLYNGITAPLKAYRLGLQYQNRIGNSLLIRPVLLYEYEEYLPLQYRNKFNAQVIVTKRF